MEPFRTLIQIAGTLAAFVGVVALALFIVIYFGGSTLEQGEQEPTP